MANSNLELGLNPKWRWDEIIKLTKANFDLEIDVSFTDLFYAEYIAPIYSKNRYYHSLRHIEYMLSHVLDFSIPNKDRVKLKWAIWFHDIVYDTTRTDNEKKSADMLVDFATALGMDEKDIEEMKWLILVTTHKGSPQTRLEDVICDLDLREFASDRYELNGAEIRKEYSHVSNKDFAAGRIQFLNSMLSKEFIYHTDEYRSTLEATARINLQKELDTIKQ